MKKNPVYKRLLRIEMTLILFLVLCILIFKGCFGPDERDASQQTGQNIMLTEPARLPHDKPVATPDDEDAGISEIPDAAPDEKPSLVQEEIGLASYYQDAFHGHPTASGERYDVAQYTAAHRELPFGAQVRVTNITNGKQIIVRINDRGPNTHERIIDLSGQAARALDLIEAGIAQVRLEVLR